MRKIFTDEKVVRYVETRLFGKNVKPFDINQIILYQGFLPSTVREKLNEPHLDMMPELLGTDFFKIVEQDAPREPIYESDGNLALSEFSYFERANRYIRMIEVFLEITQLGIDNISWRKEYPRGRKRVVQQEYSNFAYDFAVGLFVPDDENGRYDSRRVFRYSNNEMDELFDMGEDIKDISDIIIGPLEAVEKEADKVIIKGNSEYLPCQIVEVDGRRVLNLGYVYGGQAGLLLDKIFDEYDGLMEDDDRIKNIDDISYDNLWVTDNEGRRRIRVHALARLGGLQPYMKRDDQLTPVGVIDEADLLLGNDAVTLYENIHAKPETAVINLNVGSVIDETYEGLEMARRIIVPNAELAFRDGHTESYGDVLGGSVDLEIDSMVGAIKAARRKYGNNLDIQFGFVGHVSDVPLNGDTLDVELADDRGERQAAKTIIDYIRRNH